MKRIALALLLLWPLAGALLPALAQSPELMAAFRQYQSLNAQGKYAEAEAFARTALELGEDELGPNHQTYALLLDNLPGLHQAQGRYGEAEPLYKRSLAILKKALGPDHPHVATSFNNLAELYRDQGHYGEAEPLHKGALAIWEKSLGPDHRLTSQFGGRPEPILLSAGPITTLISGILHSTNVGSIGGRNAGL
jgi:tetratricopeptide (TPR) repeat protein